MSISAEQRLPDVLAELIDAIVDGEHVAQVLELLTRRSVELFEVASAGIIVADPRGGYRVLAASDERADLAELFQSFELEGPAFDVVASGNGLTVDLTSADGRWPGFARAARGIGIGWVHALPIRLDAVVVGALNLFRPYAGGDLPDPVLGQALCGLVSVALAQERPVRRSERLAERIQQILNERGRVEQVKGIVAAHMAGSPADAYAVLEFHARAHGVTVVAAANDVIEGKVAPVTLVSTWRRGDTTDGTPLA
ncbi:MAG: hypothetical protein JWP48_7302 [Actinoallomurus sp.]|nr:hypothetical protein [Actinoallomurus sp.]